MGKEELMHLICDVWAVIPWSLTLSRKSPGWVTSGINLVGILAYFLLSCWVWGSNCGHAILKLSSALGVEGFHWPRSKPDLSPLPAFSFLIFPSSSLSFSLFFLFLLFSTFPPASDMRLLPLQRCRLCRRASQASEQGTNVGNTNNESWSTAAASLEINKCCS